MKASTLKERLKKRYPYRIELHSHTPPISTCSHITPKQFAEVYSEKGYDGVVLTNHFMLDYIEGQNKEEILDKYINAYHEVVNEAEKYNIKIYLGAEIRFTENYNDYLIYGADRDILSVCYDNFDKGLEYFRKNVKLNDSVLVHAHPYRDGMTRVDPKLLDGVEIYNMHIHHNPRNAFSVRYAKENGIKIRTAGTDLHRFELETRGGAAIRTRFLPEDSFGIAKILKSGDYVLEVAEDSIILP